MPVTAYKGNSYRLDRYYQSTRIVNYYLYRDIKQWYYLGISHRSIELADRSIYRRTLLNIVSNVLDGLLVIVLFKVYDIS